MEDENEELTGVLGGLNESLTELTDPSTSAEAQSYARRFLNKQLHSPIAGKQGELMTEMERQAEEARGVLRAARAKLAERRYNPADKWYALSAALGQPTRVGGVGELASRAAGSLRETGQKREDFDTNQQKELLGYDKDISNLGLKLLELKSGVLTDQGKIDADLAKESLKTLGKRVTGPQSIQNKAQQAVDREYAKDYLDWIQDGSPVAEKSLGELGQAADRLRGYKTGPNGERIPIREDDFLTRQLGPTGAVAGTIATVPFVGKAVSDIITPGASDIREIVESTVQSSLRPILGAQFTEKEGERLIARVYNPRLKREVNAARVLRLQKQIAEAARNKNAAARWFEEHGTLQGFKGKLNYTIADFMPADSNELAPQKEEEEETTNPDDDLPAIDPNAPPVPKGQEAQTAPVETVNGKRVIDYRDLPKRRKKNILGFAEGGAVPAEDDSVYVRMPDGSLKEMAADTTQEDVSEPLEQSEPADYDPLLSRAALAGLGAGTGYVGARVGMGMANSVHDMLPGRRETSAEARLLRLLERDKQHPKDIVAGARRYGRMGVPTMPLDASPNLRALAEDTMPSGGAESLDLLDRLNRRQADARNRAGEQVNKGLKPDEYFAKEEELKTKLYGDKSKGIASESSPMYDASFQQFPAVKSKQLGKLLDTPSGQKAVKAAMKTMEDKGKSIGKRNAVTGAVMNPSLEFLNQVKIEMDNLIGKAKTAGQNGRVRDLTALRNSFRSELDTATTDPTTNTSPYKESRGIYEGGKENLDILQMGREEFGTMQPQELAKRVSGMSFEQKDFFRTGVAQKITEMLNAPSTDINAARRLVGSPAMKAKLETLFDSPAEFKVFETALNKEMDMFEDSNKLLGKEASTRRRGTLPPQGKIARGAQASPTLGVFSPTYWALKYLRKKPEISEKEASEVISMLKASTPDELTAFEKNLGSKFGRRARRKSRGSKAGMIVGALGAGIGAALPGGDEEPIEEPAADDPALVGLDEEGREWANTPAFAEGGKVSGLKGLLNKVVKEFNTASLDYMRHDAQGDQSAAAVSRANMTRLKDQMQKILTASNESGLEMAEGGKVGALKEAVQALKTRHAQSPMDMEYLKSAIQNIAMNVGESAQNVWRAFTGSDAPAAAAPATRIPAQPEALAPYAKSMDREKAQLEAIRQSLALRNMSPDYTDQMAIGSNTADLAYQRMMSEPTPQNMQRLSELVRSLQQQAERRAIERKRRGGIMRRHSGGMTNHG